TYKKVVDLGIYKLFPNYNGQFLQQNNFNSGTIFAKEHIGGTPLGSSREGIAGPKYMDGVSTGYGTIDPTQEMVDAYFMANGLPIDDPHSCYNPQKPYKNRGERFYASIIYDGATWGGAKFVMKQGVGKKYNATDMSDAGISTV